MWGTYGQRRPRADRPDLLLGGLTPACCTPGSPIRGCNVDLVRTRRADAAVRSSLAERLASDAWDELSRRAADPEASPEDLHELAEHYAWVVRAAVAGHPRVSVQTLEVLRADRAWGVRAAVRRRDQASEE